MASVGRSPAGFRAKLWVASLGLFRIKVRTTANAKAKSRDSSPFDFAQGQSDNFWRMGVNDDFWGNGDEWQLFGDGMNDSFRDRMAFGLGDILMG
jgi:hypothetical protein